MPGPPAWLLYIKVEDVDQAAERVQELGGKVLNGPMEVPGGGRIAQCMDPQGAAFAIHSSSGQTADGLTADNRQQTADDSTKAHDSTKARRHETRARRACLIIGLEVS